ncbi:hypothetical protein DUNSADRAFT_2164 [Dunaliella salina]|uniref:Uncharacterized protein n=1 Tax=Dunaliella salina TaxID=3046 RepID=A0ABQ7H8E7_DUNSA|nr:hypothetical protein DUNSADRAFT_2164 [Dunaliella salina]|eukprot:KAF5843127.1 hypothetical protein DUNSADRAFT_2164 [Dunaliella salina]
MPLQRSLQHLSKLIYEHMGSLQQCPLQPLRNSMTTCASFQAAAHQQRSSSSTSDSSSTSQEQAHLDSQHQGQGSTIGHSGLGSKSIQQLRAKLFGAPLLPHERTGRRVLARKLQGEEMASWYFNPPTVPGIHNEEREYVLMRKKNKRVRKQGDDEDGGK